MKRTHSLRQAILALCALLACCPCASALDPSLDISQYAHTSWTVRDGFFKGQMEAIAQTPDGYLWLGTELGLLRFDGVRAVPWQPPAGARLASSYIRSLLAARDGTLWIGTLKGLASWKDGKLTQYPELAGQIVDTLLEDRDGTVWAGGTVILTGRLCAIESKGVHCYGEDGSFGQWVESSYEDSGGNLWVGAENGLWRWGPGPPKRFPISVMGTSQALDGVDNRAILIVVNGGIRQVTDGRIKAYPLPDAWRQFRPSKLLRDRNGGLWIGTLGKGLLHIHQGQTDLFAQSEGLSGDSINGLFEDREGNIWVASPEGLDRFRDFAVPTISVAQGLSDDTVYSVLATTDGSVWLGSRNGLSRWNKGQITIYRKRGAKDTASEAGARRAARQIIDRGFPDNAVESLGQDNLGRLWVSTTHGLAYLDNGRFIPMSEVSLPGVRSVAGDAGGNLWISDQGQGLFNVRPGSVATRIPWTGLRRHGDFAISVLPDPAKGGLWLGFLQGDVEYFKDGQVRASYSGADGLGEGSVNHLLLERDGTLWAATAGGLSRVKDGHVATITSQNGLPCDPVNWVAEDDADALWLYMTCGLVRVARPELDAWVASLDKDLPNRTVQAAVFDSSDGVRLHSTIVSGYGPPVAKSSDGKLWFLSGGGASVVDPHHLPVNKLPPPVHVEQITADRKTYDASSNVTGDSSSHLRLPPLVHDLEIDYTALSLVAAEKNRFRVKLEGWDRDWQDVGNRRQAFYNNLSPGSYRFRVTASNNSGVWNEAGTFLDFSIAPAYYQTNWFRLSCVIALMGMLWGLYRLRLHQLARQFNMRLGERVNERTRIARELHDTLLQNLHGLLFRFQAARNMLPRRTEEAMEALDGAISRTEQAIAESRDTIKDLRYERVNSTDLAELLTQTGRELESGAEANGNPPIFRVIVEGERRTLSPALQDEVYRIARELLRNAFQHAHGHHIEAEIRYDHHLLRVLIRDDGKGMDPKVLKEGGQPGHWGLPGVRERAKQIGARLDFWSEGGAGTEVQLTVPVSVSSERPGDGSRFQLFGKSKSS
jgi:signal transduction histidine kinase/ligand-binding sensor domain-containing protein